MELYSIISLGLAGLATVLSIITTARKNKRATTMANCSVETTVEDCENSDIVGEVSTETPINNNKVFGEKLQKILEYITNTEKIYNAITTAKVGKMKLQDVLTKLKVDSLDNGEKFDSDLWTTVINNLITFSKNVNSSNQLDKKGV